MDDLIAFVQARIDESWQIAVMCEPGRWFPSRARDDPKSFPRQGVYGHQYMEVPDCAQPRVAVTLDAFYERHKSAGRAYIIRKREQTTSNQRRPASRAEIGLHREIAGQGLYSLIKLSRAGGT
ncbi:hypothetical protein [Microtetraspora malaysiensis]|uniref:hypothetical protein n=1 Tax=Microtetraspora malaysiensis TaxID=161358 RepID=UPI003D8C96D0